MNLKSFITQIPRPSVIVVTGRRGSGKDVTACAIADEIHKQTSKPIYSSYDPKEFKLPKRWNLRKAGDFNKDTIHLISDVHLEYFAREWHAELNKAIIKMVSISRHKNIDFIWTTQLTTMLDRQMIANVDVLVFKEPSTLAARFERPELKDLTKEASVMFVGHGDRSQLQKWELAYVYTHTGEYRIDDIKKPPYFTEKMSKVYADKSPEKSKWRLIF